MIYEYTCKECCETTTEMRKVADRDEPIQCEHCGSWKTARVEVQPIKFELKGGGWAKDKYGSN